MLHKVEIDLFGTQLSIESGVMAKQADGAVIVRSGDNVVLVTACCSGKPRPGAGFFPLTVDYREATYAAGKFPGGFIKREGRMTEKETLTCRLIDRPVRPLFPEGFRHDTQIIGLVFSAETERDPGPLAMVGYLVGGLGDAAGEPAGVRWGRHRYRFSVGGRLVTKTFEGSLEAVIVSL